MQLSFLLYWENIKIKVKDLYVVAFCGIDYIEKLVQSSVHINIIYEETKK